MSHAVPSDDEVSATMSESGITNENQDIEEQFEDEEDEEVTGLVKSHEESHQRKSRTTSEPSALCCKTVPERPCHPKLRGLIAMFYLILLILFVGRVSLPTNNNLTFYFPHELLDDGGVYEINDFLNSIGNTPPYWEDINETEDENNELITPHVGPCYLPFPESDVNWYELMNDHQHQIEYLDGMSLDKPHHGGGSHGDDLAGLCRPGFIIIGAGKCGTSSLYHYLVGHPRVLPAKTKQIHYFKYFTDRPMRWYLSNFPSAQSFLSNGALMTGEASPGYLPYPEVAHRLKDWMYSNANNGIGQPVSAPKIITIARNPLERSWSSYKYNYFAPLIDKLRKHDDKRNDPHTDDYYKKNKIFSFEELIAAELKQLKKCLQPGGKGEEGSDHLFGHKQWAKELFERRSNKKLPPLITIDEICYGGKASSNAVREQWEDLVDQYPEKVIKVNNVHLVQSLIGRSLYTLPLEWWYELYPKDDLYLFCNEDLKYNTTRSMSDLSDFLGLPTFDFTEVVSEGMYNVGGNEGYDTLTDWSNVAGANDGIPISDELRAEYLDFVRPYNERLFQLTGKRCNWD